MKEPHLVRIHLVRKIFGTNLRTKRVITVNKQLTYEKNVNIPNDRLWMKNVWSYIDFFCLEWLARNGQKGVL